MRVNELNKNIQKMANLNSEQREALLSIIDDKIENDMEKILLRIDAISKEHNAKIDSIKWFIVSAMAFLGILMTILKFYV